MESLARLWAGDGHVNATGVLGSDIGWWIVFTPQGPSCWAAWPKTTPAYFHLAADVAFSGGFSLAPCEVTGHFSAENATSAAP